MRSGRISGKDPPAIGTRFVLAVGKGEVHPYAQRPARMVAVLRLDVVEFIPPGGAFAPAVRVLDAAGGCYPPEGFKVPLTYWNRLFAPHCVRRIEPSKGDHAKGEPVMTIATAKKQTSRTRKHAERSTSRKRKQPESPTPAEENPLAKIDKDTPVGRRFEFDELATAEVLIYEGPQIKRGRPSRGVLCFKTEVGANVTMTRELWRETWAPHVTGYTDPPAGRGAGPPGSRGDVLEEFVQKGQKAQAAADKLIAAAVDSPLPASELVSVAIDSITVGAQPRQEIIEPTLVELADSMDHLGQLQPIVVLERKDGYLLIAGQRRLMALARGGHKHVRAMVYRGLTDRQAAEMQLAENFQRRDLNHVEVAAALGNLRDAGADTATIAAAVHKSVDYVREHLDLLRLDDSIRPLVASGRLPIKQAAMIARVGDQKHQVDLACETIGGSWKGCGIGGPPANSDWVLPMFELRRKIQYKLKTLGGRGWPMDAKYAAHRPCTGCPDNTATEPALFEGVNLPGKSKKGNCTNAACYEAKVKAWAKDPVKKAREKKRAQDKAKKAANRAEAGDKTPTSPKRERAGQEVPYVPFPSTAEDHYNLALYGWAESVLKAVTEKVHELGEGIPADAAAIALRLVAAMGESIYLDHVGLEDGIQALQELTAAIAGKTTVGSDGHHVSLVLTQCVGFNKPFDGCRAFTDYDLAMMDCVEVMARRWGVKPPDRPVLETFQRKVLADGWLAGIKGTKVKDPALAESIGQQEDLDLLKRALAIKGLAKAKLALIQQRIHVLADVGKGGAP